MKISAKFEPGDLWIGLFVSTAKTSSNKSIWKAYICIIPMFPIAIESKKWLEWHNAIKYGH